MQGFMMKKKVPVIETERLRLRPVAMGDADEIFNNWAADERVARYMTWTVHPSAKMTAIWLRAEIKNNENGRSYHWAFVKKEDGRLIGSGSIFYNEAEKCYELGYQVMYSEWYKGYATESVGAIVDFALNVLGESQLVACHIVGNEGSGRVLEKCGFVYNKDRTGTKSDGKTTFMSRQYRLRKEAHRKP